MTAQSEGRAVPRAATIFVHIPKCGGLTLIDLLERMYPLETRFRVNGSIGELVRAPRERREKIAVLMGHMHFGVHRHLPTPARYITILRNPLDRVVSFYYFARETPRHYLHEELVTRNLSLEDAMRLGLSGELENEMTKVLSGVEGVPFGECTEDLFRKAKEHLRDRFEVVGLLERFDETLILLRNALGWKTEPLYVRRNATRGRPRLKDVPDEAIRLIEEHNRFDLALYDYGRSLFEEKLNDPRNFSPRDLRSFRLANRLYRGRLRLVVVRQCCRETLGRWFGPSEDRGP